MVTSHKKKRFSLFSSQPSSPIQTPILGSSLNSYFPGQPILNDKALGLNDVQKAVENLGRLVSDAGNFCDLVDRLAKASKAFSKSLKEYGNNKGMDNSHVMCLQAASQFYENYSDAQNKSSKHLQKEFEALQKFWEKYSKKVAKEEKAFESVNEPYKQIKKIDIDYEKKPKKDNKAISEAQEKNITYKNHVAKREKQAHGQVMQIICRITDGQFTLFNESLKKCGGIVTKINEWSAFATMGIPAPQEIDSILEEQIRSPIEDTSVLSRKLSRKYSHRISKSIASISDMQLAAMNYMPSNTSTPLIEEPENYLSQSLNSLQSTEIQIPHINATKSEHSSPINILHHEPMKRNIVMNEKTSRNRLSLPICPTFSSNINPSAQDLISKISIGIDENDAPFFRDYGDYDILNIQQIAKTSSLTGNEVKRPNDQINKLPSVDNFNAHTNLSIDTEIGDPEIISDAQFDDSLDNEENENSSNKKVNKKYSFETQYLVHSFPINLPVRTPPYSPSVSPKQTPNVNYIIPNFEQKHITKSNDELGPKKGAHVYHNSDGGINHNRGPLTSNSVHSVPRQGHVNNLLSKFDAGRTSKQEKVVDNFTHVNESTKEIDDSSNMNESNRMNIINSIYSTFGNTFGKKKFFLQ
ncbi:26796_t:CDS:2 [Dentiscutata erythropus]|uniref:26796_t:CDS:1 n=1 Tax=Dentiscutata erythropus TaxID=1348616 RepID=A0A9N8WIA9_9GLOM|nr:26796_t:CDS:2 [Dentiscutata erythropus]